MLAVFQDVQYSDIDYMDGNKDFTINETAYPGLSDFAKELHDNGQKYVIIMVCSNTHPVAFFFSSFKGQRTSTKMRFMFYFFLRTLASSEALTTQLITMEAFRECGYWTVMALRLGR